MRTAEDHRAAVAAWSASAPANDSEIFTEVRPSSPRHAKLSGDLKALLHWRAMSREPEASLQTNWRIVPANDNRPEEYREDVESTQPDPILVECIHEIRPRPAELMRAVRSVEWREFHHARNGGGGAVDKHPVGGDIETRPVHSDAGANLDKIVRLGDLRLGTLPTEAYGAATLPGNDRHIVAWRGRRPVDRFTAAKGPDLDIDEERQKRERLADWLGCDPGWHVVATKESRAAARARGAKLRGLPNPPLPSTSTPLHEARAAVGLPPIPIDLRPALPLGSPDIGNIFAGWVSVPKKGKGGASAWDDRGFDRSAVEAQLSKDDIKVLDAAISVQNFKQVGEVLGFEDKTAERRGKAAVIQSTSRLSAVLEKIAA